MRTAPLSRRLTGDLLTELLQHRAEPLDPYPPQIFALSALPARRSSASWRATPAGRFGATCDTNRMNNEMVRATMAAKM